MKQTYDEVLMDWMFDTESKLKQFEGIKEQMKEVYLADDKEIILGVSFGKDSSLNLVLMMNMLRELKPEQRTKKVYVISADTMVETGVMSSYVNKNLAAVQKYGKELGIITKMVKPNMKERFFFNTIGKGLPAPNGKSRFRWCTGKMKLDPMSRAIQEIMDSRKFSLEHSDYDVTLIIGTRLDESTARAQSIKKFEVSEFFSRHHSFEKVRVYSPVKYITTFDLWIYLENFEKVFPWGEVVSNLKRLYENGKECPIVRSASDKSCGGNRNGCWTCLMGGRKDAMLETLSSQGYKDADYLAEYKSFLYDVSFDIRYREPLRRKDYKAHLNAYQEQQAYVPISLFEELDEQNHYYTSYKRAYKGDDKGEYRPGGFTFSVRKILMEKLLYTQKMVGYTLIEEDEIHEILDAWNEDGYFIERQDLKPINHQYDGALVFNPDWTINRKETENKNPVFYVEHKFKYGSDELISYIKERQLFMKEQIFCYFDHDDYENDGLVWNKAVFVVCKEGIQSQEQANEYVSYWLYIEGEEVIGVDGRPYNKMVGRAKDAALQHLLLQTIDEIMISKKKAEAV